MNITESVVTIRGRKTLREFGELMLGFLTGSGNYSIAEAGVLGTESFSPERVDEFRFFNGISAVGLLIDQSKAVISVYTSNLPDWVYEIHTIAGKPVVRVIKKGSEDTLGKIQQIVMRNQALLGGG